MVRRACFFFKHGVCVKSSACTFLHDDEAVPLPTSVATRLRDFVKAHGLQLAAGRIGEFYKEHPGAKAVIVRPKTFCANHPHLLQFEPDGGAGVIRSVPVKRGAQMLLAGSKAELGQVADTISVAAQMLQTGRKAELGQVVGSICVPDTSALHLAAFVAARGGSVPASQLREFYAKHPEAKAALSVGAPAFCKAHPGLLRFEVDNAAGVIHTASSRSAGSKIATSSVPLGDIPPRAVCETAGVAAAQPTATETCSSVALRWKDYLDDGRQHLIGQERDVLKKAYDLFLAAAGIKKNKVYSAFGRVMATLQQLGFEEHGTWATSAPHQREDEPSLGRPDRAAAGTGELCVEAGPVPAEGLWATSGDHWNWRSTTAAASTAPPAHAPPGLEEAPRALAAALRAPAQPAARSGPASAAGREEEAPDGSAAAVRASVQHVTRTLDASVARLEAWELRLRAREAQLDACEAELAAREARLGAGEAKERRSAELRAAAQHAAEAASAEERLAEELLNVR